MTPVVFFSVALIKNAKTDDDKLVDEYAYVATCDRCGKELPEVALPITIINLKGKVPPGQVDAFKKAWRAAVARSTAADHECRRRDPEGRERARRCIDRTRSEVSGTEQIGAYRGRSIRVKPRPEVLSAVKP